MFTICSHFIPLTIHITVSLHMFRNQLTVNMGYNRFMFIPGSNTPHLRLRFLGQVCGSDEDADVLLLCDHCNDGCANG